MADTFLCNVDTDRVEKLMKDTFDRSSYFENTVNKIVTDYTERLDIIMAKIKKDIVDVDIEPSAGTVEKYFLELSNQLYYTQTKAEALSIYDALSKSAYKEVYNKAYLDNQIKDSEKKNKTTVAENQAVAENASIYESTVNDLYSRIYKTVKIKIDAAQTMVNTLSKVLSRRMQDYSNDKSYSANGLKILNESSSGLGANSELF